MRQPCGLEPGGVGGTPGSGTPFTTWLRKQERRCSSHAELALSSLEECRKCCGKERGERTLAGGHEKVPRGFLD